MKAEIHPKYVECKVTCGCGNSFVTRSTEARLAVEICSNCHPFYTGQQRFVDTAGRVEKFQRKYAWSAKEAVTRGAEDQKKALAKAKAQKKRPVRKAPVIKVVAPEATKAGAERGPGGGPGRGPGGGPGGRPGGGGRRRAGPGGRKGEAAVSSERQRVGKPREEPPAPEPPKAETPPQAEAPKPEAPPAAAPQPETPPAAAPQPEAPPADKPQGEQA